ncbi:MAG: MBL fold metallo-hydrolase [Chloroflexi bacterium]|nr:MBL fold metallo-hydrolase [Chloroflexota bacterium]
MEEIRPGIYHLPLGWTSDYLVTGDDGNLLIDTAWESGSMLAAIRQHLGEVGLDLKDITQVFITHSHPDHYGLAGSVKRASGASIAMHRLEADLLVRYRDKRACSARFEKWLSLNGVPERTLPPHPSATATQSISNQVSPDIVYEGGESISIGSHRLQVVWTPGHMPGHICLYDLAEKLLFSGDFLLPTITTNISLSPLEGRPNPLDDFLDSLERVKALDIELVLPAHEHAFTGVRQRVTELLAHHDRRNGEILSILDGSARTAYDIATKMTWARDMGGIPWGLLSPWDQTMALLEALAHLESLNVAGKVSKFTNNGTIYFRLA